MFLKQIKINKCNYNVPFERKPVIDGLICEVESCLKQCTLTVTKHPT